MFGETVLDTRFDIEYFIPYCIERVTDLLVGILGARRIVSLQHLTVWLFVRSQAQAVYS